MKASRKGRDMDHLNVLRASVPDVDSSGATVTTRTQNGASGIERFDPATRTRSLVSPEGRTSSTTLDAFGRPVGVSTPGAATQTFEYDALGRLHVATAGTADVRRTVWSYDGAGHVQSITSSGSSDVGFSSDIFGRPVLQTVAGRSVGTSWDAAGNLSSVTTPLAALHKFTYTRRDDVQTYTSPLASPGAAEDTMQVTYTPMGALQSRMLANGKELRVTQDSKARPTQLQVEGVTYLYDYDPSTGSLRSLTGSDQSVLSFDYDGSLVRSTAWSGPGSVQGSVGATYNENFDRATLSIDQQEVATFDYDRDTLLTRAGSLAIARSAETGQVTGTMLGRVTTSVSYSEHGSVSSYQAMVDGAPIFGHNVVARDGANRITSRTELLGQESKNYQYAYDNLGRLVQTKQNGTVQSTYGYDDNGNRLTAVRIDAQESATFGADDRILTHGNCAYVHDRAGFLVSRDCDGDIDSFTYDARGTLTGASLASGDTLAYVNDAVGRRVGRKRNGVLEVGWLYDGRLPVAQLDGSGTVTAVFVYGTRANAPDYILEQATGRTLRILSDHLGSPRMLVDPLCCCL